MRVQIKVVDIYTLNRMYLNWRLNPELRLLAKTEISLGQVHSREYNGGCYA